MTTHSSTPSSSRGLLLALAMAFGLLSVLSNLLFLSAAIACLGMMVVRQPGQRAWGLTIFAVAILFFLMVFGYGVGKDMAKRDNASQVSSSMEKSAPALK